MHIDSVATTLTSDVYLHKAKCETNKKPFTTEEDAVEFEKRNREIHKNQRQFPYKCEDCPDWHLTSTPPGIATMARVNYSALGTSSARTPHGETRSKVRELFTQGLTRNQIAEQLNISYQSVCAHLRKDKLGKSSPPVVTLESIAEEKKQLEAKLQRLQQEEQRLIDLKALKVVPCWDGKGILISKEGGRLALPLNDCTELMTKLEGILDSLTGN